MIQNIKTSVFFNKSFILHFQQASISRILYRRNSNLLISSIKPTQTELKLTDQITKILNKTAQHRIKIQPYRAKLIAKIDDIVKQTFKRQNPKLILYGSSTANLDIETSDIDLCIDNIRTDNRADMSNILFILRNSLQVQDFIHQIIFMHETRIPIMKLVYSYSLNHINRFVIILNFSMISLNTISTLFKKLIF